MGEIGETEPIRDQSLQNAEVEKDEAGDNNSRFQERRSVWVT